MSEEERRLKISETLKKKYTSGERKSWNKNKKSSENHKKNISKSLKNSYAIGKRKPWNKGKKSPIETKNKQSIGIKNNLPRTIFKKGQIPHNYNGGRYISSGGYVFVLNKKHTRSNKKGYVREHRLVMEKHLGRYLIKEEVVHHINGIRMDNRIENLKLFSNDLEHIKFHKERC